MKAILNNKLYDTDKSELLCNFNCHLVYKTNNGTFFMTYNDGEFGEQILSVSQDEIKNTVGLYSPDNYIKFFGEPEEA